MKSAVALLMIGIILMYSGKHSLQYFNKETTGLKVLTALLMAPYHIFDFGLTEPSDFIKNILIYVLKMNEGLTGVERHEGVQVWDDQTGATGAFRQEGSDGEDRSKPEKEEIYFSPLCSPSRRRT